LVFLTEKGSFTKRTTTGTDVISHGMGDTPKILIFWTTAQTATGFDAHVLYSLGFSDVTRHKAISGSSEDAQTSSDASRVFSATKCIVILTPDGVLEAEADISAVSSTNFTVNWTTNGGGADIIHYMLFSGNDITVSEVGEFDAATTTGNQVVPHTNSPAGGYDVYMFLTATRTGTAIGNHLALGLGFATDAANEAALCVVSENGRTTTDTHRFQREDRSIVVIAENTGAIEAEAEFVSKRAEDFTVNWIDAPTGADRVAFMGIKGGQHKVGNFTEPGSTGLQGVITGFQPVGYLLASYCRDAQTTSQAIHKLSLGGSDATVHGVLSTRDEDAVTTSSADTNESTDDVFRIIADTGDTIIDAAEHNLMGSNSFQLDWTNIGSTAEIFFWAFGSDIIPEFPTIINVSAMI